MKLVTVDLRDVVAVDDGNTVRYGGSFKVDHLSKSACGSDRVNGGNFYDEIHELICEKLEHDVDLSLVTDLRCGKLYEISCLNSVVLVQEVVSKHELVTVNHNKFMEAVRKALKKYKNTLDRLKD